MPVLTVQYSTVPAVESVEPCFCFHQSTFLLLGLTVQVLLLLANSAGFNEAQINRIFFFFRFTVAPVLWLRHP
jgi:hypothetical protein